MITKPPTPAQQRRWRARIMTEFKNGTPAEETNRILNEMIVAWQTVGENAANVIGDQLQDVTESQREL